MLVVTEDNQMYSMQLSNLDIIKSEDTTFELLGTRLHAPNVSGQIAILGLDVCIRKPLVVTGGSDKSVRVWNFQDKSVDLMRVFEEDITSCAFHSGLVILVDFTDKLQLMNLLMDDIRTFKEFSVKACNECVFSTGGHLFAAVSGNAIHLYDFYISSAWRSMATTKGHVSGLLRQRPNIGVCRHGQLKDSVECLRGQANRRVYLSRGREQLCRHLSPE